VPAKKAAASGGRVFVARTSFAAFIDGRTVLVQPGQLVDADDPILKGRENLFNEFEPNTRSYSTAKVEQATAAPGEKRA
jgi:hypothetical protein